MLPGCVIKRPLGALGYGAIPIIASAASAAKPGKKQTVLPVKNNLQNTWRYKKFLKTAHVLFEEDINMI